MKPILNLWFFVALIAFAVTTIRTNTITPADQCPGESFENLRDRIQVIPCGKSRCHLPRNTNITVVFKFAPKKEVKTLLNEVHAQIAGVSLPFIGVTGTSACGHVMRADTGEPVACPLPPDQEYVYTKIFPVLPGYPTVGMRVHWHLHDGDDKVICFEVPATITHGTKRKLLF